MRKEIPRIVWKYFNTSHVSINLIAEWKPFCFKAISIHLMFLLISEKRCKRRINNVISIHLMFLLIVLVSVRVHQNPPISIHLMFLLIFYENFCEFTRTGISIHLMFLLIRGSSRRAAAGNEFQYISCFY